MSGERAAHDASYTLWNIKPKHLMGAAAISPLHYSGNRAAKQSVLGIIAKYKCTLQMDHLPEASLLNICCTNYWVNLGINGFVIIPYTQHSCLPAAKLRLLHGPVW